METQENRPVMQHDLPKNYNGAYKLLGKNVKTPIEPAAGTNTLVLGPPASGKTFSYVYSNLKKANASSFFPSWEARIECTEGDNELSWIHRGS